MRPPVSTGAVVLAGGASSRMGVDKASLAVPVHGSLLAYVVARVGAAVPRVVVVGRPGQPLPPVSAGAARVERVDDDPGRAGQGPLVGLAAGLARLHEAGVEHAYLGSVDAPGIGAAHVLAMLSRLGGGVVAVVPEHGGHWQPLAGAVCVAPALVAAQELLAVRRRSARALLQRLGAHVVRDLADPSVLAPCNTPEQWTAVRVRLYGHDGPPTAQSGRK